MIFGLRTKDGTWHSASSGSYIDKQGAVIPYPREAIRERVLSKSPEGYGTQWQLELKGPQHTELWQIESLIDNAVLDTRRSTGVTYWEGPIKARQLNGSLTAQGYLEMTGVAGDNLQERIGGP
jgi:predicted secreted hydrolase